MVLFCFFFKLNSRNFKCAYLEIDAVDLAYQKRCKIETTKDKPTKSTMINSQIMCSSLKNGCEV